MNIVIYGMESEEQLFALSERLASLGICWMDGDAITDPVWLREAWLRYTDDLSLRIVDTKAGYGRHSYISCWSVRGSSYMTFPEFMVRSAAPGRCCVSTDSNITVPALTGYERRLALLCQ